MKKLLALFAVIALLISFTTAAAQTPEGAIPSGARGTYTITEAQINASYPITNPLRRSLSDVYVDLQPAQVVITATVTLPGRGSTTRVYDTTTTVVFSLSNNRVTWTVTDVTINGATASQSVITQVNAIIAASWRSYFVSLVPGHITSLTLTDDTVTVTVMPRR